MENKTILLTGGSGSFGQEFVRQTLAQNPKVIRIYSRGESLQQQMRIKFDDKRLRFFIGDVRDRDRLRMAMDGVDIVVHAAALKQIDTCEYNPIESVKTNILGSLNVVDVALECEIEKVMGISTDKAVEALNLYGKTKAVMESLFILSNLYGNARFSCVRYGNVLGSRGSFLELIEKQKETGIIEVTDKRMTRFWLTVEDGVKFVLKCLDKMKGGEIFVPKVESRSIMDIVNKYAPDCQLKFIGIRPGEKLHEVLIAREESRNTTEYDNMFIIGKGTGREFEYSSNSGTL